VQRLVHDVFINAYASAMRPTLAVVAAALLLGALSCNLMVRRAAAVAGLQAVPVDETAAAGVNEPAA
jgi:hypothetical protein